MATENAPLSLEKTNAEKRRERPHWVLDDAVYSISALLLSVIIIHSIWTLIIRPRAEAVLSQRVTVTQAGIDAGKAEEAESHLERPDDAESISQQTTHYHQVTRLVST